MPAPAAVALAALAAASGGDLRLELAGRAEGRTSTVAVRSLPATTRGQLDLAPRGALALDAGTLRLSVAYLPSLRVSATSRGGRADVLHDATLRGALRGERLTIEATAEGVRGITDPLLDPLAAGRALPTTAPLTYLGGRLGVGGSYLVGPRTTAAASARASVEGGADAAARDALPLQRSLELAASVDRLASPRDTLRLGLAGSAARTGSEARAAWARATAAWQHLLSSRLAARGGGGAAVLENEEPGRTASVQAAPLAELGVAYTPEDGARADELVLRVTPAFDRLTGEARSQVEAVATARRRVAIDWTLATDASGAVAWQGPDVWNGGGSVALRRATGSGRALEFGLRARWYVDRSPSVPSSLEVSSFVALAIDLTARAPSREAGAGHPAQPDRPQQER